MKRTNIKDFFLYCGIKKDAFYEVRDLIWERNRRILRMTSIACVLMGIFFAVFNKLTGSDVLFPYIFLAVGSAVIAIAAWAADMNKLSLNILLC